MKRPVRYILYLMIGFLIYEVTSSDETGATHRQVRDSLIVGLLVVFVLLLIVKVLKQRHHDGDDTHEIN